MISLTRSSVQSLSSRGDLPNFDEECKNINDHDQIVTFVGRKTKVGMYAEELDIVKPQANMVAQDDIFVYDSQDKRADIKTYIRNRLQEYVKNTIDICMAAARAGKLDECMMVYNNACCALKFIERDLEQFKRDNLVQDIQE